MTPEEELEAINRELELRAINEELERRGALEPPPDRVGKIEAALRGAEDMIGFSLGDEARGVGAAAAYGLAKGVRAILPGGVPEDAPGIADVYRSVRDAARARAEQATSDQPVASAVGAGAGLLAQIGPRAAVNLARVAPSAVRGLLTREGLKAALPAAVRGAGPGAVYGALQGAGRSEADLTQGEVGEFAEDVGRGTVRGAATGAVVGGLFGGGAAGARQRAGEAANAAQAARTGGPEAVAEAKAFNAAERARARAENAVRFASREAEVARVRADNLAGKERATALYEARKLDRQAELARLKGAAEVQARTPSREKAVAMFGADDVGTLRRMGGGPKAQATFQRIYDEPVPGMREVTYGEVRANSTPFEWEQFTGKVVKQVGEELGALRERIGAIPNTFRAGSVLLKEAKGFLREVPNGEQRAAFEKLEEIVGQYGKGPSLRLDMATIRNVVDDLRAQGDFDGEVGRFWTQTYRAATQLEKSMIAQRAPDALPQYNTLLGQYADALALARPARRLSERAVLNPGEDPVRWPAPEKVTLAKVAKERFVPKPLPGKMIAERPNLRPVPGKAQRDAAEAALAPRVSLPQRLGRAATEAIGAALVGSAGYSFGGIPGTAGMYLGARGGRALGQAWFKAVRPTTADLVRESDEAQAVFERLSSVMNAALRAGPAAANALHRALMKSDREYRRAVGDTEASRVPADARPVPWDEFRSRVGR